VELKVVASLPGTTADRITYVTSSLFLKNKKYVSMYVNVHVCI
jgi:hypothetical protein